jgi:GntR family transcriptional repressor for pyruvate dehydrogenase complex
MSAAGPDLSNARDRRRTKPQKTAMLLAQRIVDEITDRDLAPGTTLPPEQEMVTRYGVARGTLREALRYLESQGVITIKPGPRGGPVVTDPDPRFLASTLALLLQINRAPYRTVIEARQIVEPALAARAAARISPPLAEELSASTDAMAGRLDDLGAFLDENHRFHLLIARLAGNELFAHILASLSWITDGTAIGVEYPPAQREVVVERHREIAAAIATGDPDEARARMRAHLDDYARYVEHRYPQLMDQRLRWEDITP